MPWADVNGVTLRYEISGVGPPLVLLHEMGGTLESWSAVVKLLPGRRILRFDTRGAGLSEKIRAPISLDDLVADLAALIDLAGMTGAVAMAGVAVGAAIALRFAAHHPARVSALVAMAPATGLPTDRRPAAYELADRLEREGMRGRILERIDQSFPIQYRQDPELFAAFRGRMLANDPHSYAAIYRMLAEMDLSADLPRIACRMLAVAGCTDGTRPAAGVRQVADAIPGACFVELASGHVMPVLTPILVGRLLADFLDEADPAGEARVAAAQRDESSRDLPASFV